MNICECDELLKIIEIQKELIAQLINRVAEQEAVIKGLMEAP
jgi:hypothetical protein